MNISRLIDDYIDKDLEKYQEYKKSILLDSIVPILNHDVAYSIKDIVFPSFGIDNKDLGPTDFFEIRSRKFFVKLGGYFGANLLISLDSQDERLTGQRLFEISSDEIGTDSTKFIQASSIISSYIKEGIDLTVKIRVINFTDKRVEIEKKHFLEENCSALYVRWLLGKENISWILSSSKSTSWLWMRLNLWEVNSIGELFFKDFGIRDIYIVESFVMNLGMTSIKNEDLFSQITL